MEDPGQISEYGKILLMAIIGTVLVCATILLSRVLSPKNPNPIKLSTYECGEDALGTSWVQFNPRFYVIALVFLLFDVELIFIFPWATVFGNTELNTIDPRWGWLTLIEMAVFIGVLIMGLVYVWKSGDISWIKPTHKTPKVAVDIPSSAYENLNNKTYPIKAHNQQQEQETLVSKATATVQGGFRPKFKKPTS